MKRYIRLSAMMLLSFIIFIGCSPKDEADNDLNSDVVNEETEDSNDREDDKLSDKEVDSLKEYLEDSLHADRDVGDLFYLDDFKYNKEDNIVTAHIDMQKDPLPDTAEEVKAWAEAYSTFLVRSTPQDLAIAVKVTLVTKHDDGRYTTWGQSVYDYELDEYRFEEESGMKAYR